MTTTKQIKANRENAKRSTGPKTRAGKAKVRYNAMKHGMLAEAALLPDEDEETFRSLAEKLTAHYQPEGEYQAMLVEEIINTTWRLRRASQVETGLFVREDAAQLEESFRAEARELEMLDLAVLIERTILSYPPRVKELHDRALTGAEEAAEAQKTELALLGGAFARSGNAFANLARYETALWRRRERAVQLLREDQEQRTQEKSVEAADTTPAAASTSVPAP